jgi:hypothetical protein
MPDRQGQQDFFFFFCYLDILIVCLNITLRLLAGRYFAGWKELEKQFVAKYGVRQPPWPRWTLKLAAEKS